MELTARPWEVDLVQLLANRRSNCMQNTLEKTLHNLFLKKQDEKTLHRYVLSIDVYYAPPWAPYSSF